jgi:hypothetical protein
LTTTSNTVASVARGNAFSGCSLEWQRKIWAAS